MWTGNEFQAAGPATVNELSANRDLVCRTTKLPRVDDRRRWSLQRLHRSVRYIEIAVVLVLNDQFVSVVSRESENTPAAHLEGNPYPDISTITFRTEGILKLLKTYTYSQRYWTWWHPNTHLLKVTAEESPTALQLVFQASICWTRDGPLRLEKGRHRPSVQEGWLCKSIQL